MSSPESTPTHLPWTTLCQSRTQPYARVDCISQSGTLDFASVILRLTPEPLKWPRLVNVRLSLNRNIQIKQICKYGLHTRIFTGYFTRILKKRKATKLHIILFYLSSMPSKGLLNIAAPGQSRSGLWPRGKPGVWPGGLASAGGHDLWPRRLPDGWLLRLSRGQ